MAEQILFTKKVRNPITHDWISEYRVIGDENGEVTAIQRFDENGTAYPGGKIDPEVIINTTTPTVVETGSTFDAVSGFTVDEYGRLTEVTLTRYQVPEQIIASEDEPDGNALLWIRVEGPIALMERATERANILAGDFYNTAQVFSGIWSEPRVVFIADNGEKAVLAASDSLEGYRTDYIPGQGGETYAVGYTAPFTYDDVAGTVTIDNNGCICDMLNIQSTNTIIQIGVVEN